VIKLISPLSYRTCSCCAYYTCLCSDCQDACAECKRVMCEDCVIFLDSEVLCRECGFYCDHCDEGYRLRESFSCNCMTNDPACMDCALEDGLAYICDACNKILCTRCNDDVFLCDMCGNASCLACLSAYFCTSCSSSYCFDCIDPCMFSCDCCRGFWCSNCLVGKDFFLCSECEEFKCAKKCGIFMENLSSDGLTLLSS
jgi:hypothetical protein